MKEERNSEKKEKEEKLTIENERGRKILRPMDALTSDERQKYNQLISRANRYFLSHSISLYHYRFFLSFFPLAKYFIMKIDYKRAMTHKCGWRLSPSSHSPLISAMRISLSHVHCSLCVRSCQSLGHI